MPQRQARESRGNGCRASPKGLLRELWGRGPSRVGRELGEPMRGRAREESGAASPAIRVSVWWPRNVGAT